MKTITAAERQEIFSKLRSCWINTDSCEVHPDGTVDCNQDVVTHLDTGIRWGTVNGNFTVRAHSVCNTLIGSPRIVNGMFVCKATGLKSLEGGPESTYDYICSYNDISSLKGIASTIRGHLECQRNPNLTDIHHIGVCTGEVYLGQATIIHYGLLSLRSRFNAKGLIMGSVLYSALDRQMLALFNDPNIPTSQFIETCIELGFEDSL